MGCRSDYLDPNPKELESKFIAASLVLIEGKDKLPSWVVEAADEFYGNAAKIDLLTAMLCKILHDDDSFINDIHSEFHRKLMDWWVKHKNVDHLRILSEGDATKLRKIRKVLTQEQNEVLDRCLKKEFL